ncbi:hypothetical protein [Streptomyces sp. NPDC002088]|uniref:hypothetical protein n=1 Tax=Streptomyces sp. NPDC002088 TaxID=3154665 RepID=UPI0033301B28
MRAAYLNTPLLLEATATAVGAHRDEAEATPTGGILPDSVRGWLARLRLLEGVPFAHLVADSALLPPESIRLFYLDREWTDSLVQGGLSVGTVTTLDREDVQALHAPIRREIDAEERKIRAVGGDPPGAAPAETITGFLLRSRTVSGWPALHVRGYREEVGPDDGRTDEDDPRRLRLLRLERLAPAVLLCLFDGIPAVVHVEEPRQGIQFGVDLVPGASGTAGATIPLRDVTTAERLDRVDPSPAGLHQVSVPFRKGAPGVIGVAELARRIAAQPATHVDDFEAAGVQSAEFAMEMLQFPFRQVFGDPELGTAAGGGPVPFATLFQPTIGIGTIRTWTRP